MSLPTPLALLLRRAKARPTRRASVARGLPARPAPRRPTRTWWSSGPARPRRSSATRCSCSSTTTSATRSSSSPTSPATSFKLASATPRPGPRPSTSCSAASTSWPSPLTSLTGDEQKVVLPDLRGRLLDGRHGHRRAGRRVLGRADRGRDRRAGRARLVHEPRPTSGVHRQARRDDLYVVERRAGAELGLRAGRQGALPARPAPGRNTAVRDLGMSLEDCVVYNPHSRTAA